MNAALLELLQLDRTSPHENTKFPFPSWSGDTSSRLFSAWFPCSSSCTSFRQCTSISAEDDAAAATRRETQLRGQRGTGGGVLLFSDGEHLMAQDILEAPGKVVGKAAYGTLYRANIRASTVDIVPADSVMLLLFVRPACTRPTEDILASARSIGFLDHPNLVPLTALHMGPRGEKLFVHPFFSRCREMVTEVGCKTPSTKIEKYGELPSRKRPSRPSGEAGEGQPEGGKRRREKKLAAGMSPAGQDRIRASHILIKHEGSRRKSSWKDPDGHVISSTSREKAIELIMELRGEIATGRALFEDLATRYSDCSSAKRGGDLGRFGKGQMQKPFEQAAFSLKVGELSDIVETDSGVHLILRTS